MVQFGINLNPRHPAGQPANVQDLQGAKWARIVFQAASARETIEQAFAFYDPIIERYHSIGMRTCMVLNQETFWGHGPWDNGNWERYAVEFAAAISPIVVRYRGKGVAYEIWNEGDIRGHSSIYVPPNEFAKVLQRAAQAIKSNDPSAPVVFGGLAAAVNEAVAYVQEVRKHLGGNLPVDAIGIHPYGQWTPNFSGNPGWGGWFGNMTDYMKYFVTHFPNTPLWMTEIGVSEEVNFPPDVYPMVIQYMQGVYDLMTQSYPRNVPVVMWFAWSDVMRQAGIVDAGNNRKAGVYDKFFELARRSEAGPIATLAGPKGIIVAPTTQLRIRSGPGTEHETKRLVDANAGLIALEALDAVQAKIGKEGQWLKVRTADGAEGFVAAWYLTLVKMVITTNASGGLNIRKGPGTSHEKVGSALPGDDLVVLEAMAEAVKKIGQKDQWIRVRIPDGTEGYAAAWFIIPLPGTTQDAVG